MFTRSRSRRANDVSYTGVGVRNNGQSEPNSNAMAAALTIGKALKSNSTGNNQITNGDGPSRSNTVTNSIFKRNSVTRSTSIYKMSSFSSEQLSTPPASSRRSSINGKGNLDPVGSHDAHHNSSYSDEHGPHYDTNRRNMQDLKVSHTNFSPPQSGTYTSQGYPRNSSLGSKTKMVKKYIPTPTGIKVVEVPETTYQKELARNNSLRGGRPISRSNSINRNLSNTVRNSSLNSEHMIPIRNTSRVSSITGTPRLGTMVERDENVVSNDNSKEELEKIEREIAREKQISRDLAQKRLEYEKYKNLRLEEERKLISLQHRSSQILKEESSEEEEDVPIVSIPIAVDEVDKKKLAMKESKKQNEIIPDGLEKKEIGLQNGVTTADAEGFSERNYSSGSYSASKATNSGDESGQNKAGQLQQEDLTNNVPTKFEESPHDLSIMNDIDVISDENNFSSEIGDVPNEEMMEKTSFAKHLRPKFESVPEIIAEDVPNPIKETQPIESSNSSVFSSEYESESPTRSSKKPMKSAMKNSSSSYKLMSKAASGPAQQAYLSLTTAENTRLNSKMSAPKLGTHSSPASQITAGFANNSDGQNKSSSLRKSASQGYGLSSRTLRPQSNIYEGNSHGNDHSPLASRSFRESRTSTYVPPIAVHPTQYSNYQSPSKLKAAELYAKANSASPSFDPTTSKRTSKNRTTLRDMLHESSQDVANDAPNARKTHAPSSSRFQDSDDEPPSHNVSGRFSRFKDSDEDLSSRTPVTSETPRMSHKVPTLRQESQSQSDSKPTKRKFSRLRKIFGRN